jgi:hypothetical protein
MMGIEGVAVDYLFAPKEFFGKNSPTTLLVAPA